MKNIKIRITTSILFLSFVWNVTVAQISLNNYALTGASVIDANHKIAEPNQTILIVNDKIRDIFNDGSKIIPDSFHIIKLNGKYVLPGLIDAHVHMATDPSDMDSRSHTLDVLQRMLFSGITTVRDMAGDARILSGLSRDAFTGDIISPDIYYSALFAGPEFFKDPRTLSSTKGGKPGQMPYMLAVTDSTNLVLAIAGAKGTGATGIKLYANLSTPLIKKIVTEANKQNMIVWGHAWLQDVKPSELVKAGVSVISHAPLLVREKLDSIPSSWLNTLHDDKFWDEVTPDLSSLFKLMKVNNTIFDLTLLTYKKFGDKFPSLKYKYELGKRIAIQAYKAGVIIDAGTDYILEGFVQKEMELLVKEVGFSPIDAIIAATLNGAKVLHLDDKYGTVSINKIANLLILDKNPLNEINNIESVYMVIKNGRIFKK